MSNYNNKMQELLKEFRTGFRMAKCKGAFSTMKSLADDEFARLIKGGSLNEADDSVLDDDTLHGLDSLRSQDGLDNIEILKALVYDVYGDGSRHIVDMLKMMGYTDDQINSGNASGGGIVNIAASEFIDMSDLEAETFLVNYLKSLPEKERSDDLRAIEYNIQQAKDDWYEERHMLDQDAWLPPIPPDFEGMVEYLNGHGFDIGNDYMFKGDNVNEPYYIEAKTLEVGDHIQAVLDPEGPYGNSDGNPFKGKSLNIDHHKMNITWQSTSPTLREMTRDFVKMTY